MLRLVADTNTVVSALVAEYQALVQLVQPRPLRNRVGRDPDDEIVIACALVARADFIVSGDKDLLVLKAYRGIRILNTAQALAAIAGR